MEYTDEPIDILISLKKIYKLSKNNNEKRIIKRLIDKRNTPFFLNDELDLNFTPKQLSMHKAVVNRMFNRKILELYSFIDEYGYEIIDNEKYEKYKELRHISYYYKHWTNDNEEYKKLILIRANFHKKEKNVLSKVAKNALNNYTEQQIDLIIKNHCKQ